MNQPIIIGLGNPGKDYEQTYHNVGFLFLDFLGENEAWETKKERHFMFQKHDARILVKPLGFMNESGAGALAAMHYFRKKPADLLVVHDDSDLEIGAAKLSFGSGAAGHHGVESIILRLGTKNFWRLRIGIRPEALRARGRRRKKAGEFVLSPLAAKDKTELRKLFYGLKENVIENETPLSSGVKLVSGSATS